MKYRIGMLAIAGFLVAGGRAVYALASTPPALGFGDPILPLVRLTCPIAILSSYPMSVYFVLFMNAATYALAGVIVESLRLRLHHAK
jgi:hypothetical protein